MQGTHCSLLYLPQSPRSTVFFSLILSPRTRVSSPPVCEEKTCIQESSREEITNWEEANCTQFAHLKPALGRWLSFFILIKPFDKAMARLRIPTSWRGTWLWRSDRKASWCSGTVV